MTTVDHLVDLSGREELTDEDRDILERVDKALANGVALKQWWEQKEAKKGSLAEGYAQHFELTREFNESETSYGFFDLVTRNNQSVPVMGTVDTMLFDKQKGKTQHELQDQFREFIMHYFMRVSSYQQPTALVETGQARHSDTRAVFQPLSWCPEGTFARAGFGYTQHYFKLRESGLIAKFRQRDWYTIVDLREIGKTFEWVIVKIQIFDMSLALRPFGPGSFSINFPQQTEFYLIISPDFVTCEDNPTPNLLGRYGFGYVILRREEYRKIFARSSDILAEGFQIINFELDCDGQSRALLAFVTNRPERILSMTLDPVGVGFGIADLTSFGLASKLLSPVRSVLERVSPRIGNFDPVTAYIAIADTVSAGISAEQLCVSIETIEKEMLLQTFMQHYQLITGAAVTWRRTQDWLDPADLPKEAIWGTHS